MVGVRVYSMPSAFQPFRRSWANVYTSLRQTATNQKLVLGARTPMYLEELQSHRRVAVALAKPQQLVELLVI